MINNTYYESTTLSTTENSYIEEPSRFLEKKFLDLSLESLSSEKDALLEKLIKLIEEIIEENKLILEENELEGKEAEEAIEEEEKSCIEFFKKVFYLEEKPKISISKYIYRINKYLDPEISTIIISFIYIDKLITSKNLMLKIDEMNIYKLILISINIAIKYNECDINDDKFVAKVGGLTLPQFNELELNFCAMLRWELFISHELFKKYYNNLLSI